VINELLVFPSARCNEGAWRIECVALGWRSKIACGPGVLEGYFGCALVIGGSSGETLFLFLYRYRVSVGFFRWCGFG